MTHPDTATHAHSSPLAGRVGTSRAGAGEAALSNSSLGQRGTYSPVLSTHTVSPLEQQVLDYRERWTGIRDDCARRCDMRGVGEANDHIKIAAQKLTEIAAGRA